MAGMATIFLKNFEPFSGSLRLKHGIEDFAVRLGLA
jgi:hypothetical protein